LSGGSGNPREWLYAWYNPSGGAMAQAEFVHDAQYKLYADGRFYDILKDDKEKTSLDGDALDASAKAAKSRLQAALRQNEGPRPASLVKQSKAFGGEAGAKAKGSRQAKGGKNK